MADTKLSALAADTSPTTDDLIYVVNDPAGTPGSKQVTLANTKALFVTPGTTDNALVRADGVGGATIQGSAIIVSDTGSITIDDDAVPTTISIKIDDQGTVATAGNRLNIAAGKGNTTGAGGVLSLSGGAGGNDAVGGQVTLTGGAAGGGNRAGGGFNMIGGDGAGTAAGGSVSIAGGSGGGSNGAGGTVTISGGNGGATNGHGSDVTIQGGFPQGSSSNGGNIFITGRNGQTLGVGGSITLQPGKATAGTQGTINLKDPNSTIQAVLDLTTLAASDKTFTFPNTTGTFALTANNLGVFAVSTSAAIGVGTIELGHASDTTIARSSAGVITVEGNTVWTSGNDGAGSTLDADLLDGKNTGTSGNVVPLLDGANTWSAQQTMSLGSAATTEPLRLVNTTDNSSVQVAQFEGDRATMADNDEAYVSLLLSDNGGNQDEQARITWKATTVAAGATQDGQLIFSTLLNNSLTTALTIGGATIDATFAGNVALGANNLTMTGSLAATGSRVTKGWFTDIESTNMPTVGGASIVAVQATQETGTSNVTFVTPGVQQYHPSAAKFWVRWTGGSTTILEDYNVDSIANTGTGDADGTITTDFSNANWCGIVCTLDSTANGWDADSIQSAGFNAIAAGTFGVLCGFIIDGGTAAAGLVNPTSYSAVGFGDQ